MKEVAKEQKSIEKLRQQRKATNNSKPILGSPGVGGEAENCKKSSMVLVTDWQF
jgi:hypothetical protein